MNRRNSIIESIPNPTKNFLSFFLVGIVLFALIANGISGLFWNYFSDWLQAQFGIANKGLMQGIIVTILILCVLALIYITPLAQWLKFRLLSAFQSSVQTNTNVTPLNTKFAGLIVAMSPRRNPDEETPAERVILYHANEGQEPHLKHCWLICTQKSLPSAKELVKKLVDRNLSQVFQLHYGDDYKMEDPENPGEKLSLLIPDDLSDDPLYIQRLTNTIYADAETYGLQESELITDFTGGLKSMTVGMILACTSASRYLQYISQLDNEIKEIKIAYKLKPDKS